MNKNIILTLGLVVLVIANTFAQSKNRTEPLWWINPNTYVMSELNAPKHMKMPKVVLPDADGDGIPDQFDVEPNTPAGVPVDNRGVARDTDGDGVPDYKDKELLTPQKCFPVNADGIGSCPESSCCTEVKEKIKDLEKRIVTETCNIASFPPIEFKSGSALTAEAKIALESVATQLKANPTCHVKVIGHGASSKALQQLSYEKVSAVIKFLVEQNSIAENRVIFVYGQEGASNVVDLQPTTESGPNTVAAPHPHLKSGK